MDGANLPLILKSIAGRGTATALYNDDFRRLEAAVFLTVEYLGVASVVAWAPAIIAGLIVPLYKYPKKSIELTTLRAMLLIELKPNGLPSTNELTMGPRLEQLDESETASELQ
ncbi:hypothetical protein [Burkholderia cepacia]|uniref:hypothetical protein n=1 Tax=Burkholderia cepacia TaxID=292 RepID=UPI000AD133B2|nr:hypothetical protein [Burkholderia cepacia]CAG9267473.1 hypothetical protein BCEP4_490008 [Burkholderia cepacia]